MTAEPDPLDAVIQRVCNAAPPADGWDRTRRRFAREQMSRRRRSLAPVLAAAALAVVAGWWLTRPAPRRIDPAPVVVRGPGVPTPEVQPVPVPPPVPVPGTATPGGRVTGSAKAGSQPTPGGLQPPRGIAAGVWASPRLAVAAKAPVFVSTGDVTPIKLGGTVPAGRVGERVHVWDWEKGADSRVLAATCTVKLGLAPDGTAAVTADGRRIDLAAGTAELLAWWAGLKLRPSWVLFAPDAKTLLAFEHDGTVGTARLIDYPAGTERTRVGGLWWAAWAGAFSPDGRTLVMQGTDAHLRAFDTATGAEKVRFAPAFANTLHSVAVSADGSRVAGAHQAQVRVWDAATGRPVCEPDTKGEAHASVAALAFSPDGKRLAGGGSMRLSLWDAADGKLVHRYPADSFSVGHVRFDPNGTTLTTVKDFYIPTTPGGREETVYPVVDRWRVPE